MLVLIAGITGSRNPDSLGPEISEHLESFIQSDSYYDVPALEKAVAGVDAVINAYSPIPVLDLDGDLLLIRAAERAQINIFIASSWSRDWTNIKFNDFEHYNNHLAFQDQIATTSTIRPVYILTGIFTDLLYTPYGPGGFDTSGDRPRMRYWGNEDTNSKWPWSTQDDAATRTIDILLHGDGVQAGKGGFFKIRSGVTTIEELAAVHEEVFGVKIDVTRAGSVDDLEKELARLRKEKGRTGYGEYMSEAAALIASKGLWENTDVTVLDQFKKSATLEEYFTEVKNRA